MTLSDFTENHVYRYDPTTPMTWASGDKFFVDVSYTIDNT